MTIDRIERIVVCENCGEIIEAVAVGPDGDDSDILVPAEDCPLDCVGSDDDE